MVFSSPSTLWALGLLAIPIIIHLFQFRRYKRLYFSDTSLFHEIKAQSQTKNQIKHLLILLARLLFMAALILAFAQPMIPSDTGSPKEPDLLSFYVDNSYSMTALGSNGSLLNEALEVAYRISDQYPEGTRIQLITNALTANEKRVLSLQDFNARLDLVESSGKHRDLKEVVAFQDQAVADADVENVRSFYISDFNGTLPSKEMLLPADSNRSVRVIQLSAITTSNLSVDSVWSKQPVHQVGITQTLSFRVTNHGQEAIVDQKVDIHINDQLVSSPIVSIQADSYVDTSFQFSPEVPGILHGRVSIDDSPITYDDDLYFTLNVSDMVKVVEVSEKSEQASPFTRLFSGKHYRHLSLDPNGLIQDSLKGAQLVILNGLENWNLALTSITEQHLEQGGNLLIIPPMELSEALRSEWSKRFGFNLGSLDSIKATVRRVNTEQPLFDGVFESIDEDINLPSVESSYRLESGVGEEILSLPTGNVFLGSNAVNEGKVYLLTSPLSKSFTNFTEHALFVPIMINLAVQSGNSSKLFRTLEAEYLPWSGTRSEQLRLTHENGKEQFIPGISHNGLLMNGQIERPGIYNLHLAENDTVLTSFAFNHNRDESSITYPSPSEIKNAFVQPQWVSVIEQGNEDLQTNIQQADLGTDLWPWFIAIALLFLLMETLLLKLFKP